jgi:hypothetical protein
LTVKYSILFLALFVLAACAQVNKSGPYHTGSDDSNTVNSLTSINPSLSTYGGTAYPGQLYNFLADEDANRFYEQGFQNAVSTQANAGACLGATGAGLTMTPTSCVAYNAGYRSTETGSITFTNAKTTWVAMDENTSGSNAGLPNFTRVGSTHYLIDDVDASQPTMAFDSQLLMEVVTSGGSITGVTDLRNKQFTPQLQMVSNGMRVATDFPGSDIGAQVNSAIASFPSGTCGKILIPAGSYTCSTQVLIPILAGTGSQTGQGCWFAGQSASQTHINVGANGCFSHVITSAAQQNSPGSKFTDMTLDGGNQAGVSGIVEGGVYAPLLQDVQLQNFSGTGSAGAEFRNPAIANTFTEGVKTRRVSCLNDARCIWIHGNATGTESALHHDIDLWLSAGTTGQHGIDITNGAVYGRGFTKLNGNLDVAGTTGIWLDTNGSQLVSEKIDSGVEFEGVSGCPGSCTTVKLIDCSGNASPPDCNGTVTYDSGTVSGFGPTILLYEFQQGWALQTDTQKLYSYNSAAANPFYDPVSNHATFGATQVNANLLATSYIFSNAGVGGTTAALSAYGTCNGTTEGLYGTQNNSTAACSAGVTATSAGTTKCAIYCNGTNWIQLGY